MTILRHQSRLHIFTFCSLVLHSGSQIPAKGEDMFNICCQSFLLRCICGATMAFNTAKARNKPQWSHFSQLVKNKHGCLCKEDAVTRNRDASIYHAYTDCEFPGFPVYPEYDQDQDKDPNRDTKIHVNLTNLDFRALFNQNIYTHGSDCVIGLSLSHYTRTRGELIY